MDLIPISDSPNRGKDYADKKGVEASLGKYILFSDAYNSTPIEDIENCYPHLKDKKVVIGFLYLPKSKVVVRQPWHRVRIRKKEKF